MLAFTAIGVKTGREWPLDAGSRVGVAFQTLRTESEDALMTFATLVTILKEHGFSFPKQPAEIAPARNYRMELKDVKGSVYVGDEPILHLDATGINRGGLRHRFAQDWAVPPTLAAVGVGGNQVAPGSPQDEASRWSGEQLDGLLSQLVRRL